MRTRSPPFGEFKQLDMPPMTMVFEVSEKAMLDSVKAGDKVKFKVRHWSLPPGRRPYVGDDPMAEVHAHSHAHSTDHGDPEHGARHSPQGARGEAKKEHAETKLKDPVCGMSVSTESSHHAKRT